MMYNVGDLVKFHYGKHGTQVSGIGVLMTAVDCTLDKDPSEQGAVLSDYCKVRSGERDYWVRTKHVEVISGISDE